MLSPYSGILVISGAVGGSFISTGEAGATWHLFTHRRKEQGPPSKTARFGHVEHGRERERISSNPTVVIFCSHNDDPAVRSKGVFDEKKRGILSRVLPFWGFRIKSGFRSSGSDF